MLILCAIGGLMVSPPGARAAGCSNEPLRIGPSADLPDCRAYELVTPPDTNGRFIASINTFRLVKPYDLFPTDLGSPMRDSFVYMTYASPLVAPSEGNGFFDVYEALRGSEGWQTVRRITPSGVDRPIVTLPGGLSADHLYSFANNQNVDFLIAPDNSLELTGVGNLGTEPYAQGRYISEDGKHVIFSTGENFMQSVWCSGCEVFKLEADAAPTGTGTIYDREADGETRVVSLLPGDVPQNAGEEAFYQGTSKNGAVVAFKINGSLYVRVNNEKTLKVADGTPTFAGLSDDGDKLFYLAGGTTDAGTIHRFDTSSSEDVAANASTDAEIVNVSADGSHVYFISPSKLDGTEGTVGQPNLYVWGGAAPEYITTVAPSDLVTTSGDLLDLPALTNWTDWVVAPTDNGGEKGPGADSSRTTPNGEVLVFESRAQLTPYDNAEADAADCGNPEEAGEGCTEIYRYDDSSKNLICLSCDSLPGSTNKDASLQKPALVNPPMAIHNVTDDGSRVFFETAETLVGRDTDGVNDIYEWKQGAPSAELISSGKSTEFSVPQGVEAPAVPPPNLLFSVTPDGEDAFFLSQDALVPRSGVGGVSAVYDARIGGGFEEPTPPTVCLEEDCRPSAGTAPSLSTAPSEKIAGGGNVKPRKRRRCHHPTHKRNGRHRRRCSKHRAHRRGINNRSRSAGASSVSEAQERATAGPGGGQPSPGAPSSVNPQLSGAPGPFGIKAVEANGSTTVAGQHPDLTVRFALTYELNQQGEPVSEFRTESVSVSLPPGLLGRPNATLRCSTGQFVAFANCPIDSQVGITKLAAENYGKPTEPIYNLEPPHPDREVARFGFYAGIFPVYLDIKVRTASDYGVTATVHNAPSIASLLESRTILWGNPADPSHDKLRLTAFEAIAGCFTVCKIPEGERHSGLAPTAFLSNPSACQAQSVDFEASTYQLPGQVFTASAPLAPITDCVGLPFAPTFEAEPTSHEAGASTGLKTKLILPQHLGPDERATATMREARVTLPEGMQVAAGAANWIGTCSEEQVGYHEEVDTACADNSKLGTATIISPALSVPIEGTIYQRNPRPGNQLGLWLTADALGLHIKLPGSLEPDKTTGRLTAVFSDLPQVPVEEIDLDIWGGERAPLQNPDHCGTFTTDFSFAPHSSDPAATGQSQMQITEGCNQGFSPTLHAGVTGPVAGKYSPFVFDLTRPDGNQALRGFSLKLPDGELAKLKGVPLCSDADASAGTCPQGSRIGSIEATTGPGPDPLTIPQPGKPQPEVYLAGPYEGASFSILSEVPAQAGPFDLGTLAVRSGLDVEPETGRAVVKADPLPQFFEGVGIAYRNLHAVVDRPGFSLNPTDCREMAVNSDVTSTQGAVAHPAARFQVDRCKALKFKPKLSLKLKGGTARTDYPALTAVLKARNGDANIAFTSVALPHSEFLAQEHIGTICTRKQFAADKCPKGSVYGKAKAITPLLGKPLSGPVYLRSSDHPLPDLVAKLGGQLEIDLVGRIDSKNGGIRTTFDSVPDAPVTKFVLQMRGGKKGLLTNSTDICRGSHRAAVAMKAQNERAAKLRPVLQSGNCGKKKLGNHKHHR
jgi:hypothetical protein